MTGISDDDLLGLDEFGLLPENAEQIGATGPLPSVTSGEFSMPSQAGQPGIDNVR